MALRFLCIRVCLYIYNNMHSTPPTQQTRVCVCTRMLAITISMESVASIRNVYITSTDYCK